MPIIACVAGTSVFFFEAKEEMSKTHEREKERRPEEASPIIAKFILILFVNKLMIGCA